MKVVFVCLVLCLASSLVSASGVSPMVMINRDIGGADLDINTPGSATNAGAYNVGLIVKTTGRVTYVDEANEWFWIDDGCKLTAGNPVGRVGVRVDCSQVILRWRPFYLPALNSYVIVEGIVRARSVEAGATVEVSIPQIDIINVDETIE